MNKQTKLRHVVLSMFMAMFSVVGIFFMATYMNFSKTAVFHNENVSVTNNPVSVGEPIRISLSSVKRFQCGSTSVRGYASSINEPERSPIGLNVFVERYMSNTEPGRKVLNSWSFKMPEGMTPGEYRITVEGSFDCQFLVFEEKKSHVLRDIYLVVVE